MPGGDVNPYIAVAALLAAGLHGIEHELPLEPAVTGNAYAGDAPRVPSTLTAARELFEQSEVARAAFGDDVVATMRTRHAWSSRPSSPRSPTGSASVASNASEPRLAGRVAVITGGGSGIGLASRAAWPPRAPAS